jgi:hypothetical protein
MVLLLATGLMLALNTAIENMVSGNFQTSQEGLYAADAVSERVMDDLASAVDWNTVLLGAQQSVFVDGLSPGVRTLSDRSTIDLSKSTNLLNCGHAAGCTVAEMNTSTADRPWGTNNPRWVLYAYGPLAAIASAGTVNSNFYVAGWVADDQCETDDDPTRDGDSEANPGSSMLTVHAEAFGPGGAHKVVEVTIRRIDPSQPARGSRLVAWRELRTP